jgi:hypothetical protein
MWLNVLVPDIKATFEKAIESGFNEIQPVTELSEMGVSNAVCIDPFGYIWMLHQVHREVSFEERCPDHRGTAADRKTMTLTLTNPPRMLYTITAFDMCP